MISGSSGETVTREIFGNVPKGMAVAFYIAATLACGWAAYAIVRRVALWRQGRPADAARAAEPRRPLDLVRYLTFQDPILKDRYAGIAHLLTFHGFVVLLIGTFIVFLEEKTPLHFFHGWFYRLASCFVDLGGLLFVVGLAMFLRRRHAGTTPRLLRAWWVPAMSWLLLAIAISGYLLEAARIAETLPPFERWSVVGYTIAVGLRAVGVSGEVASEWHRLLWGGHAILCIVFFAAAPTLFFRHILYSPASWATKREPLNSTLRTPALEAMAPGAQTIRDLAWTDLLQADACTTCGRCDDACPANAAGRPLRPRDVVLGIRAGMDAAANDAAASPALADSVPEAATWSCTTCNACNHACPVGIDVYDKIVELRRGGVEAGAAPEAAAAVFESTASEANPYGRRNAERLDWASGLDAEIAEADEPVELLYWVGCAGSFDPDGQAVSRAMLRILKTSGIKYKTMGCRERCTGDPARRMGEEGLFQQQARENIARLNGHGPKLIVTHCAHCFNTLKNEYPALGGNYAVEHHTQFLKRLLDDETLSVDTALADPLTYHDPCYLARGNGETSAPRDVLGRVAAEPVTEMPRHGTEGFCCGAGGGSLWLDPPGDDRMENIRSREAAATGAKTVVTGCPFCKTMLQAGAQSLDGESPPRVRDIAELMADAACGGGA